MQVSRASTAKGSVALNASTGALTYKPASPRHVAARNGTTPSDNSDAVTDTDGFGGVVAVPLTVAISPNLSLIHI